LGSSAYPDFCGFGKYVDEILNLLDARRLVEVGLGDELGDREVAFRKWSGQVLSQICIETGRDPAAASSMPSKVDQDESGPAIPGLIRWKEQTAEEATLKDRKLCNVISVHIHT